MKRLVIKPINEDKKEDRIRKYEENIRRLYEEAVKQNRADKYKEIGKRNELRANKE